MTPSSRLSGLLLLSTLSLALSFDCSNTMCVGTDSAKTTIPCDQTTNNCTFSDAGAPTCTPNPAGGVGVDCDSANFLCLADPTNGTASCAYTSSNCYNDKCAGSGDKAAETIPCDQKDNYCNTTEDGTPVCQSAPTAHPGDGVNCTTTADLDQFYCSNNADNGQALCNYPPKENCYNSKCTGSDKFSTVLIDCDQSTNRCSVNGTGYPVCSATTRGAGINCTITPELDEYYCSNDDNGQAVCVFPPKQNCYNSKCTGSDKFSTILIDCDQSTNRCSVNGTGYPVCLATTRGAGINCTTTATLDEYYCSNDADNGDAVCNFPPKQNCYNSKCTGSDKFSTVLIDCDQSTNRCSVNGTGYPVCLATTRGAGINCTTTTDLDEYYCSTNTTSGDALCEYPPKHDCYNSKCTGSLTFNKTVIDCDQTSNRCGVNATGYPLCINTTRGGGVDCKHTSSLDFYCSLSTGGSAGCVFTPVHSCYSQFCVGTGNQNTTTIACDGNTRRCAVAEDGTPQCIAGSRGPGADCNETRSYHCGHSNSSLSEARCVYSQDYSCFNSKCFGALNNTNTSIGCDEGKAYCSLDSTGFPLCVPNLNATGEGVVCSGHYKCVQDKDTGVAACQKKDPLVPLYVVLGIVAVLAAGAALIWGVRKYHSRDDGMRQSLLS